MKAIRPIFILAVIISVTSCRDGDKENVQDAVKTIAPEAYLPEWADPMGPEVIYASSAIRRSPAPGKKAVSIEETEIIITIKRDTIHGIAVRAPGDIEIAKTTPGVGQRAGTEQAIYNIAFISTNNYIGVNFDNDIFNNTDYYYTNGIRIDYVSAVFASSPFAYPMLPYKKLSMNYHGMTVVQNMYTPTNPDTVSLLVGDRPFAAYLYLGHFKNTLSSEKKYRQYAELQIGLIGPGSLGGFVQDQIHDIPPMGWENQIENDIVLNYTAEIEKGILNPRGFDLNIFARGKLGTLYTNAGAGIRIRAGHMNPYFVMPWLGSKQSTEGKYVKKWQYAIFATAYMKAVVYDASLQGGVFNKSSNYTIPSEDIERLVLQASAGVFLAYKQIGLMYEQFYISPEFKDAFDHRWGHINVTYCF